MATIKVFDLQSVDFNLFSDSDSYMRELSDEELALQGGDAAELGALVLITAVGVVAVGAYLVYKTLTSSSTSKENPDGGAPPDNPDGGVPG